MTDSHDQLPDPECAPLIKKPAGGTPPLVTTVQGILEWCARVKADEDLAIDVERASSYRYSAKAYLVQIKTEAAGILLLDPLACQLPGTFTDIIRGFFTPRGRTFPHSPCSGLNRSHFSTPR